VVDGGAPEQLRPAALQATGGGLEPPGHLAALAIISLRAGTAMFNGWHE
jgi:hypothetical protein